jgi:hypothetical protein
MFLFVQMLLLLKARLKESPQEASNTQRGNQRNGCAQQLLALGVCPRSESLDLK